MTYHSIRSHFNNFSSVYSIVSKCNLYEENTFWSTICMEKYKLCEEIQFVWRNTICMQKCNFFEENTFWSTICMEKYNLCEGRLNTRFIFRLSFENIFPFTFLIYDQTANKWRFQIFQFQTEEINFLLWIIKIISRELLKNNHK